MNYRFDVFDDSGANKTLVFKARLFVNNNLVASARASNKKKAEEKFPKELILSLPTEFVNKTNQKQTVMSVFLCSSTHEQLYICLIKNH